ncbi:hypothetical protein BS17DRAFT_778997 [Gyrodon lividus]|nr:hypothetical protein BS17DRAFT_778997 [Gyrodon lividus]
MPSSLTHTATPGPSNLAQGFKRPMSDVESQRKDPKKARMESSPETSNKRDSSRDVKRRRRKKKKAPIVSAGGAKIVTTPNRTDEPPLSHRAPLSARNQIIRFVSATPEVDPLASAMSAAEAPMQGSSSVPLFKSGQGSSRISDDIPDVELAGETIPSGSVCPPAKQVVHRDAYPPMQRGNNCIVPAHEPVPKPSCPSEDMAAQLTQELKSKNDLIASHQALLNQVQQAVTCQICLDLMYKPYALAPCGHLACYSCLVQWFKAPPPDNRPAPPAIMRKKSCPHCRAVVRERPIEVWGVKSIAQSVGKSGLAPIQIPALINSPETLKANSDPWKDIFPKAGDAGRPRFPWFFPGADIDDDDDIPIADIAPRGEDVGMLDMEDGGIYRCLDCMHEIWDGICTSCGRVYPGHRPDVDDADDDDDGGDVIGWFEEQMVAEEVDTADDPGWMGLESGDGDDDGDDDNWPGRSGAPWRRRMHLFGGQFGLIGAARVDDEGEEGEEEGEGEELRVSDSEGERSGDGGDDDDEAGYESSFIDDEDDVAIAVIEDESRIYEIPDDSEGEDENHVPDRRYTTVATVSDEDNHGDDEYQVPEHMQAAFAHTAIVTSDEDEVESDVRPRRTRRLAGGSGGGGGGSRRGQLRRVRGIVESDGSEVEFHSDE